MIVAKTKKKLITEIKLVTHSETYFEEEEKNLQLDGKHSQYT